MFLIVGFEIGVAMWLFELLSASIPRFPGLVLFPYQYSPVPLHPSVQSNISSPTESEPLNATRYFACSVTPNHSTDSSDPSYFCRYSIVVPFLTPSINSPLSSFSEL